MRFVMLAAATSSIAVAIAAAPLPVAAQQSVTIYRCTDARGALTVQNDRPCPKGSTQSKRVMEGVSSAPPPPAVRPIVPSTPATATPTPADAVIVAAPRLPPPALFECKSFDGLVSLSETGEPTERCAPLTTTGFNGSPALGAGVACEVRADTCIEVAATELCPRWQQRLRDAQAAERFGNEAGRAAAQADINRAQQILRDSTCGE